MNRHLIFIHGFLSSPQSLKAEQLAAYLSSQYPDWQYHRPQVALDPRTAIRQLEELVQGLINQGDSVFLVGSSLGGYYSLILAGQFSLPAVLINPSVCPHLSLGTYGPSVSHEQTGETLAFTDELAGFLKDRFPSRPLNPKTIMLLLQTGDEVLDYRQALERLSGMPAIIEPGGNHRFEGFERYLDTVCHFLLYQENNQLA